MSSDPPCKDANARFPWNLNLIKNVEDAVVFLPLKVFISKSFSIVSYQQEMHKAKKLQTKINSFKKQKHRYLKHAWSEKGFNETVVNRAMSSLH